MKITVVTVSWNAAGTILAAMNSVLRQRRDGFNIEYIVVDGASTDGTVERIKEFEQKAANANGFDFRYVSEKDNGLYDAMNKGIRMATGDVVGIMNSDDYFASDDSLAAVAAAFTSHPSGIDAVYADIRFVKKGDETKTGRYYTGRFWRSWMHHIGYMPPHPSVYIRREWFEKLGGYKMGYGISADFELMTRFFCKNKLRTKYLPKCLVTMRPGGVSTKNAKRNVDLNKENVRANRENGYHSSLLLMLPKYAFRLIERLLPRLNGKL